MLKILSQLNNRISAKEMKYIGIIIAAVILVSSLPYIYGFATAGPHYQFLSLNTQAPGDTNVYISMIEQAREGRLLFSNLYTSEPQKPSMFHPLWLVLGWSAWLFRIPNIIIYHLARIILTAIFLYVVYIFLSYFFDSWKKRIAALVLVAFSSGIGFIFAYSVVSFTSYDSVMLIWPSDLWISESNTFLSIYHSPLFILSQLLLILIFLLFVLWAEERSKKYLFIILGLVFFLGIVHPYDLVTVLGVLALYIVMKVIRDPAFKQAVAKLYIKKYLAIGLAMVIPAIYYLYLIKFVPAIGGWSQQNIDLSPGFYNYLTGYGAILLLAIFGVPRLIKTKNNFHLFLLSWLVANIVLIYLPHLSFQRRLTNGLHIALAILAVIGLFECYEFFIKKIKSEIKRTIMAAISLWLLAILLFGSTLFVVLKGFYKYSIKAPPYYITQDEAQAIYWLKDNTPKDSIILSHGFTGNVIPALSMRLVYIGHGHQTLNWDYKSQKVSDWFSSKKMTESERQQFLADNKINYLYYSDIEKTLGNYQPGGKNYLLPVYRNNEVVIYKVKI